MKVSFFEDPKTTRYSWMLTFILIDCEMAWIETNHLGLKIISIILMLTWAYDLFETYPENSVRTPLKKLANNISVKLKNFKPEYKKWTYFDLLQLCIMGLNVYFVWVQTDWAQIECIMFRILSIAMVITYIFHRTKETL